MAVFMCFLCWLACCWVWCGLQRGEVKRTNTFLLKIPLWTQEFEQLWQSLCAPTDLSPLLFSAFLFFGLVPPLLNPFYALLSF